LARTAFQGRTCPVEEAGDAGVLCMQDGRDTKAEQECPSRDLVWFDHRDPLVDPRDNAGWGDHIVTT
jgi:hypothetical protein